MDKKIIQILNVERKMDAIYDNEDGTYFKSPIICLALVELEDGERYVELMDISDGDGLIDFSGMHESNFRGVEIYD
ncbi:hypothetical protein [Staphylococcus chromogenes]|uniref:hypothetical protein n=1 Tax=Staphylococcus chromogenes TaxID=46126 RepID=UPI000D1BB08B|nr:hypothetical protein [Staphylococcus chromogenes]PTF96704.1 hypothetical protein BU658_09585 [Staphylococcus chromogenes]PTG20303.1 hypothetical protein BU637_07310 [Staphylococcus chromogenes]PTG65499.1 hypothetical protein BU674_04515 [Staphylococcus chromogenes]PTG78695.1 hypothetical protein BU667_08400 [Staphylococcus chromogenes]